MFPVKVIGEAPPPDREAAISNGESWLLPEETPVAFVYNRRNYAVMLATPLDMVEFAAGFSLTEKIVDAPEEIQGLDIHYTERGVDLHVKIGDKRLERLDIRQRRRTLPGNVSCGLCGLENADTLVAPLAPVADAPSILDEQAVARAFEGLENHQPLNARTRSVHGAAWATMGGDILEVREDVGRHNALDKLLGALALQGADMKAGFVVMSSRCSYELVQKAAMCGATAIASISAPTCFALKKAREARIAIYVRDASGIVALS